MRSPASTARRLADLLDAHRTASPNVLQALLAVQDALGHVPADAVDEIARLLNVPPADVAGVRSFYPDLRREPAGRHVIRVCLGESCVANRAGDVLARLRETLGLDVNATTADGRCTLEGVYCVGNCAVGPTMLIDDVVHGRVRPDEVETLIHDVTKP
jgi:NADH:ubiquinone oxidoreductase subunit E